MTAQGVAMNWFDVPDGVTSRVITRCGVAHPHAHLDPQRTALIVVDLQNAFMDDEVGHAVCPMARAIVPNVNRLASVVRGAGGGVFWIKNTFDERSAIEWSNAEAMLTPQSRARRVAAMSEGSKGQELWSGLDVRPEDEIVRKYRFSAFLPGTSALPYRLRARGFDTVSPAR
jgi:ureidoacrylate peracid hydrolase